MEGYYLKSKGKYLSNYNFECGILEFVDNPLFAHSFSFFNDVFDFVCKVRSIPQIAKTEFFVVSYTVFPFEYISLDGGEYDKEV